jgi:hypothetical protein
MSDDPLQRRVATTQALLFIKMLAGRLHEGRVLLNKAFSAKRLWEKYKNDLGADARENFARINKYFGRENLVEQIRNKFAFHLDVPAVEAMYDQAPSAAPFVDYIAARYAGHSLYYGGESLTRNAMIAAKGERDWRDALTKIFHETTQLSVWFSSFIQSFIGLMLSRHLGLTMSDLAVLTVADDPAIDEVRLPFFCPPSLAKLKEMEGAAQRRS